MAALEPTTEKMTAKVTAPSPAAIKVSTAGTASADVRASAEKSVTAPAADAAVRVVDQPSPVQTAQREDVSVQVKAESVQDLRQVKTDAPVQQSLAAINDVQRQFVPLHEAAAVVAPRVRDDVFEKIYKEVSSIRHTPTSVDVTLTPESLGTVNVKVGLEEGKMTARIDVQNIDVKHIIEANMPRLQEALQSNGLSIDSIAVFVNSGSSFADKRNDVPKKKMNGGSLKIDDGFETLSSLHDTKQYGYNTVEYIM